MQPILKIITLGIFMLSIFETKAARFDASFQDYKGSTSRVNCKDVEKKCLESGERIVDGIRVSRICWKYEYKKICDFPSKNNCEKIAHCYDYGRIQCLGNDSLGNCVNEKKRFVCKEWHFKPIKREILRQDLKGSDAKKILCRGIPCIDGNCIDKSYAMNGEMMESVSQLYATSQMKNAGNFGSELFSGSHDYCRKKPNGTMNCCKGGGWLKPLGAGCSVDEEGLQQKRTKNLCIWIGKVQTGTEPFHVNKHHFCCFGNLFTKVFQIQARKQLGLSFGSGESPNCGGIRLEDIVKLDFERMDFSEFVHEVQRNMKLPNIEDLQSRINDRFTEISFKNNSITDED